MDWARKDLPDPFKKHFFHILANGTREISEQHRPCLEAVNFRLRKENAELRVRLAAVVEWARGAKKTLDWMVVAEECFDERDEPVTPCRCSFCRAKQSLARAPEEIGGGKHRGTQ